jgi:hypothetical protein
MDALLEPKQLSPHTIRDLLPLQERSAIRVLKLIFKLFTSSCPCASPKRKIIWK